MVRLDGKNALCLPVLFFCEAIKASKPRVTDGTWIARLRDHAREPIIYLMLTPNPASRRDRPISEISVPFPGQAGVKCSYDMLLS